MDDNNGELEELKIDRQLDKRAAAARGYTYTRNGNNNGESREKKIVDHLLLLAVAALVGAVWVLGRSVAVLQASDSYQNERISELRTDLRAVEGKALRGVDGYDDNWQGSQSQKEGTNGNRGASGEKSADQRKP